MVNVTSITQYTENFIPFELFILVFVFAMIILILSFVVKKNNIIFASLSAVLSIFLLYSTFFLRWNTTYIPTTTTTLDGVEVINEITNVNQMFLSTPTLWLLIGIFAFSIVSIWIAVANYARDSAKKAVEENEELEDSNAIY